MKDFTSKRVVDRLGQAAFVVMSTRTQKADLSAELTRLLRDMLPDRGEEGNPSPDWDLLQDVHAEFLEGANQEIRRLEEAHRFNEGRALELRERRDRLLAQIARRHRSLRRAVGGTYGTSFLSLVGLGAPPQTRLIEVREQAVHILKRLRSPDLGSRLPLPVSGTPINLAEIADAMEADVQELDQLTDALTEVRTNLGDSVVRKQAGLKRHRRIFLNVARIQEAYYRLAGLDAHASRIRATVPQARSASTPPESAPEVPPSNSNTPPVAVEAA